MEGEWERSREGGKRETVQEPEYLTGNITAGEGRRNGGKHSRVVVYGLVMVTDLLYLLLLLFFSSSRPFSPSNLPIPFLSSVSLSTNLGALQPWFHWFLCLEKSQHLCCGKTWPGVQTLSWASNDS